MAITQYDCRAEIEAWRAAKYRTRKPRTASVASLPSAKVASDAWAAASPEQIEAEMERRCAERLARRAR